jgi:gamma-glutamylcyclotransferase (GGCT)/AIG2-like uncharacterized protein YtfP
MKRIAVYGSLRKGQYNWRSWGGEEVFKYIGTTKIDGFDLFPLGHGIYPGIQPGNGKVVVDIYDVEDRVYEGLNRMETGANYEPITIKIDENDVVIWEYKGRTVGYIRIEDGDWINSQLNTSMLPL